MPPLPDGRAVDLVVEPQGQVVQHRLLVLGAEAGEDLAADVGPVVAVGVLQVPDVRRRGDEDAALPGRDAGGPEQPVGEDVRSRRTGRRRRCRAAGGPRPAASLPGLGLYGIVAHLGDVEVAVLVEGRGDRAVDQRLGRDQLHAEPVDGLERLQRLGRRHAAAGA